MHNVVVTPFVKLQNDTETTVKQSKTILKNEMRKEITYLFVCVCVWLFLCMCVQCLEECWHHCEAWTELNKDVTVSVTLRASLADICVHFLFDGSKNISTQANIMREVLITLVMS